MSIERRDTKAIVIYYVNDPDKRDFPVTFQFLNETNNVEVYWRKYSDNSLTKLVYPTEYTVEVNEDGANGVWGQVIINDGLDINNGDKIAIERAIPVDQTTTFSAQTVFSSTMDYSIDKLTAIIQDTQFYNNTLHVPLDEENIDSESLNLGTVTERANKVLGFDSFGDVTLLASTSGAEEYERCLRIPLDEEPVPDMVLYKDVRSGKAPYFDENGALKYLEASSLVNVGFEIEELRIGVNEAKETAEDAKGVAGEAKETSSEAKETAEEALAEAKKNKYTAGVNIDISDDNVISAASEIVPYKIFEATIPAN